MQRQQHKPSWNQQASKGFLAYDTRKAQKELHRQTLPQVRRHRKVLRKCQLRLVPEDKNQRQKSVHATNRTSQPTDDGLSGWPLTHRSAGITMWHTAAEKPDTDNPVTALIAYEDAGEWFIGGMYFWANEQGWLHESRNTNPRLPDFAWALESDIVGTIKTGTA